MTAPRAADPARAAKALSGAAAATLLLEGIAVLFVPRGIVQSDGLGGVRLTVLIVLAVLLVLSSGVQRRPRGLLIGTVLQVPLLLTGFYSNAMWFVGGVFLLVWLYLLQIRKDLVGTPFGPVPDPPPSTPQD
ncbi:DUF4233 domain-containing protein [Modestobacter sp. Leaf380]|uniref:DUF4233 domain-containing protein n=1 Tax=Modestobacter sp. Leaf380 TaxID=1736356 RepID=UPI0006F5A752|nr:DUF4233 domain-containing protein [Modestobacter sp. Leaf380]KQS66175.1 hypothetical protein ASG41_12605 [Modestobacter sp. Leaf380]